MQNITFRQIDKDGKRDFQLFFNILKGYFTDLEKSSIDEPISEEILEKYSAGMLRKQGPYDRHLELIYYDNIVVGFLYGKIDHENHKGHKKPGYGYIMEFYIIEKYRRMGLGRRAFEHIQKLFSNNGAKRMYLTSHSGAAEKFWTALGFEYLGEVSPENKLRIFEKGI